MEDTKQRIIADIQKIGRNTNQEVTRAMYRRYGVYSDRQVSRHFGNFRAAVASAKSGVVPVTPENTPRKLAETIEQSGDDLTYTIPQTRIDSLEKLVEHFKIDTDLWFCKNFIANKWEMGYTTGATGEKKADVIPLYQVKATFVRRREIENARHEIEALIEEAKKQARVPDPVFYSFVNSGNMLELMLPDLHAGKLAWSKETGYADYDLEISVETYRRALDSLLSQVSHYSFDKIILGVGNDLLQSDNIQGTTYSGTKVDTDSRFHKVYVTVRKMLTETIEKLRRIAPVEVKLIPGNHDTLSTFTLGDSLECYFANYPDVQVDNRPTKSKTIEWGKVLLTLVHGHEGKQQDYGAWQASKHPEAYGRTKFREIHVGHKHKSALDEKFGSRVRTLSALCPPDAWHSSNMFTGNLRTAEALVWNKDRGLISQFYHNEID